MRGNGHAHLPASAPKAIPRGPDRAPLGRLTRPGQLVMLSGLRTRVAGYLPGDLAARPSVDLGEDMRNMGLDSAPGKVELGGDVRIGRAAGDQSSDLEFCRRQAFPAGRGASAS